MLANLKRKIMSVNLDTQHGSHHMETTKELPQKEGIIGLMADKDSNLYIISSQTMHNNQIDLSTA